MFSPVIKSVSKVNGRPRLIVHFIDGNQTVEQEFILSSVQDLKTLFSAKAKELDALGAFADSIPLGDFDITPEVKVVSQDDVARNAFVENVALLRSYKSAIALGIKKDTDEDYLDLVGLLQDDYKEEYANLIR